MNIWSKQRRATQLAGWAQEHGLEYLGADLPHDFPVSVLDEMIRSWGNALDTIGGRRGNDYLLTFQMERGYGRQAWLQTIVARRSNVARAHTAIPGPYEYMEVESGGF